MGLTCCSDCKREIPAGVHPYTMRIEVFPRVEESLEFIASEVEMDHIEEMKKIIAKMEMMGDSQIKVEENRVYSRFVFVLCPACRDRLAEQMERNRG